MHGALKAVAWAVLTLMATALIYGAFIAVANWAGIGV